VIFRVLPVELQPTAEAVAGFLKDDRGLSKLRVEEPVGYDIDYRPTFQTVSPEYHDVWVEIGEGPYLSSLDSVVLYCVTHSLPVKLYVGFQAGVSATEYKTKIDEARRNGVGAIEVVAGNCVVIHEAVLLSLSGVRLEDRKKFPPKYRSNLSTAEGTFKNGDPAKGCSLVYDEIEALSRKMTKKVVAKGWLKPTSVWPPRLDIEKAPWANVMETLIERADFSQFPAGLKRGMLIRVAAVTDLRNETGHKPRSREDRMRRDRELRTRFESSMDLLRDFIAATRSLRP
jgi:hypothetical protein